MAITRAQVETMLVKRAGSRMTFAGLAVTTAGSNADLADPISSALLAMGVTPTDITSPADADLLQASSVTELLDRAELRLLQNILGNLDTVDITVGPRKESLSQMADSLEKAITRLQKRIADEYGAYGVLEAGNISQNFAQKGDDEVIS